jgi:hypothetical protein
MNGLEKLSLQNDRLYYIFLISCASILGISFIKTPFIVVSLLISIPILFILKKYPVIGILFITILISTIIFEDVLPLFSFGFGSMHVTDILLCILLIMAFKEKDKISKTMMIYSVFFLFLLLSAVIAILWKSLDFNTAMRMVRYYFYFFLAYAVSNLIKTKKDIVFLEKSLAFLAVTVSLAMLAQSVLGEGVILMPGRIERSASSIFETVRILPPGQSLVFLSFITSMGLFVLCKKGSLKKVHLLIFSTTLVGVLLTYNRSYWVSALLGLMLFIAIGRAEGLSLFIRRAAWATVLGGVILSGLFLGNFDTRVSSFSTSVWQRFETLFHGQGLLASGSLEYRKVENRFALKKISEAPLTGVGPGNAYRPKTEGLLDHLTGYIHNGFLGLTLYAGIPGLFLFLGFYGSFLIRAFRGTRQVEDPYQRAVLAGIFVSGVCILPINVVNPMFQQWFSVVVMGSMVGLSEAIVKTYGKASKASFE